MLECLTVVIYAKGMSVSLHDIVVQLLDYCVMTYVDKVVIAMH